MPTIQPTSERAAEYLWFGKRCLGFNATGVKALQDGSITVICKYTPEKATLIVISSGGIICHPRTGIFAAMPVYTLDGNILAAYGVLGGGWYPDGSTPSDKSGGSGGGGGGQGSGGNGGDGSNPPPTPPGQPPNDPDTVNDPDGAALMGDDGLPLRI